MSVPSRPKAEVLSPEQKASLVTGASFWETRALPEAGVRGLLLTDGPHGLRLQVGEADHLGAHASVPATCFPPAVTLAASFDPDLAERVGGALGGEARSHGVDVLLGPGINIKRSPLCGRNFEYYSEDPLLSGVLGAAWVRGLQSQGVGASVKHFAANNQETDRLRSSSDVDPRALREIYLRAFERVVREAAPATVMCSYNRINGVYASEDPWLLTRVLREEWGYEGVVVSDWGAVGDRVRSLRAGLDLEMPASARSVSAVNVALCEGALDESVLDSSVDRILALVRKTEGAALAPVDLEEHHALAQEVAARGIVLLKNDDDLLPLRPDQQLAVIGEFARTPRYQGAGSSLVNPTRLDCVLDLLRGATPAVDVPFAAGFSLDDADAAAEEALLREAVAVARTAEVVLLMLGLPPAAESEGRDRMHLSLPRAQLRVLAAVREVCDHVVVAVSNGGVVDLSFGEDVPALLECWLGGQAGAAGLLDVLYGRVNPSGRLAETVPLRLEDTPSYLDFPGELGHTRYGEGVHVGYRWYDGRRLGVRYPFGHGLSYTHFSYRDLEVRAGAQRVTVSFTLTNTGPVAGREVAQVYASLPLSVVRRAPRELRGFASVELESGESRRIEIAVDRGELAYWDHRIDAWIVEGGDYSVEVGASSRDIRLSATLAITGDPVRIPLSLDSTLGEVLPDPLIGERVRHELDGFLAQFDELTLQGLLSLPVGRVATFPGVDSTPERVAALLAEANAAHSGPR